MSTTISPPPSLPPLHRHNSLTTTQERARTKYLSTSDAIKYESIDRVLDRRGGRTDEMFVGGEEVSWDVWRRLFDEVGVRGSA